MYAVICGSEVWFLTPHKNKAYEVAKEAAEVRISGTVRVYKMLRKQID